MPTPLKNVPGLLQGLKSSICYCASLQSGFSTAGESKSKSLYLARCDPLLSYIHNACKFCFLFFFECPITCHLSFALTSQLSIVLPVFILLLTPLSLLSFLLPCTVILSCVPTSVSKPSCFSLRHRFLAQTLAICSSPFASLSYVWGFFSISRCLLLFLSLSSSFICCHGNTYCDF